MDEGLFLFIKNLTKIGRISHSSEVVNTTASNMMNSCSENDITKTYLYGGDYNDN